MSKKKLTSGSATITVRDGSLLGHQPRTHIYGVDSMSISYTINVPGHMFESPGDREAWADLFAGVARLRAYDIWNSYEYRGSERAK